MTILTYKFQIGKFEEVFGISWDLVVDDEAPSDEFAAFLTSAVIPTDHLLLCVVPSFLVIELLDRIHDKNLLPVSIVS